MNQDPALMWGPLDQDHRHRFTTSWVWDLPGSNLAGPMRWVLGGWQWSGVMQYQTGRPFTVTSGTDNSLDGIGNDRAKLTGADVERRPDHGLRSTACGFNPAAFAANDLGTFGNVGKGAYYGPSLHTWDMGLFKNFRFNSSSNVQFRAEFFNIFNQVNFDIPNTRGQQPGDARPDHAHRSGLGRSADYPVRIEVRLLVQRCRRRTSLACSRFLRAFASFGFNANARSKCGSASSRRPSLASVYPRLLCASTSSGASFSARW